jgi:hypothetical protein
VPLQYILISRLRPRPIRTRPDAGTFHVYHYSQTQPVLGLYADHSRAGDREDMKMHFSNMDYEEIAGTGNFLMIEEPEEFNRLYTA